MARARLNPLTSTEIEVPHKKDETLQELFDRFYSVLPSADNEEIKEYYVILVDHILVDREKWSTTKIGDSDVLIAVTLKGGSGRGLFKQVLVLAAVIAVTYITAGGSTPLLTSGWSISAVAGATAISATLFVNALFPAADVGGIGSWDSLGYDSESSQTYTISNQTNKTNLYGTVPKVYGTHKMYPNIAANPYTELTTDPTTGKVIQNFYCIYSFGYGPSSISEIKIGDTEIENYFNTFYRLVDLNKPATDEGIWDEATSNTFEYYKGDNANTSVTVNLNTNQEEAGPTTPVEEYQVERSASDAGDGANQEIILLFAAGNGLTTYGTDGNRAARTIELLIEFAETGTEIWKPFNDTTVAEITNTVGIISEDDDTIEVVRSSLSLIREYQQGRYIKRDYGMAKGDTTFESLDFIQEGAYLLHGGVNVARVQTRTTIVDGWSYTLYAPLETTFVMTTSSVTLNWVCTDPGDTNTCSWVQEPFEHKKPIQKIWKQQEGTGGTFKISAESTTPAYFSLNIKPFTTNQIDVRVTRVRSYGGYDYRIADNLTWSSINTRFDRNPILTNNRMTFIEVKIQATDQLNGTVKDLSALVSSVLNVYDDDTSTWSLQETKNPAWVFADLLTGQINKRAIGFDRLDTASLVEWSEYCDEMNIHADYPFEMPRFESNFILDFKSTLQQIVSKQSTAAGASLNIINGNYGVLIDRKKTTPVQIFTPRNSWGFTSTRKYVELPHALKIKYVDGRANWAVSEEVVYTTGYDINNASVFEDFDTFGCTNNEQAWRYGKYLLAQSILRQESVSISVDFENLVCTRGDYVLLQQDAMLGGGSPARVTSVSGNDITIDDSFVDGGGSYGYTFRGVAGISTGTLVINDPDTATLTGDLPAVGDLIVWGEVDSITMDMVVKSINPSSDLTASLVLVERANEIFDAEAGDPLPEYDPQLTTPTSDFTPPGEVVNLTVTENTWDCDGDKYLYFVDLEWSIPDSAAVEVYEVYASNGTGFALADYTSTTEYRYTVPEADLDNEHSFKILAVDANGNKITLGEVTAVTATPVTKTTSPSDVDGLYINITNQVLQLDWTLISDCDINYYLLRYSPSTTATWSSSIPLQEVSDTTSSLSVQGRTGSYFIKAVDWNGNESANEATAITSIPELFNLNIIEETNDFPTLAGSKDLVEKVGNSLLLQEEVSGGAGVVEYYTTGYYYYANLLDLGEIYTVRLQSLIEAEGYSSDDLMSNWVLLSDISALASATVSDWNVETQYRSTDALITMDTWATLSSVGFLDSGAPEVWSEWRTFTIGDFTARIFDFRLKLTSNKPSITPRVFDGIIRADMDDRLESYDNLTATTLGYNLIYTPAFKGPGTSPAIQITQDDASQGDYYKITNKSLDGFTIKFYDINDTLVTRTFDADAKGYGRKHTTVI